MKDIIIEKSDLKDELKPKYFIIVLSNKENLKKCIDKKNNIAGFPATNNGKWTYLDINVNDYVSFYYNGHIYNLYKVKDKFIPEYYYNKNNRKGKEHDDPVALPNGEKWKAIKSRYGNEYIYFPYRLSLNLEEANDLETFLIFKKGLEQLGINLLPRTGLKKTHFQLSINVIKEIFKSYKINNGTNKNTFDPDDFKEIAGGSENSVIPVSKLISDEKILQSLIKRILETSINKYSSQIFNPKSYDDFEFFSEQAVDGGEVDIVIANKKGNLAFIEVKNKMILKENGDLTSDGKSARKQVTRYKDIINPKKKIIKFIAGKSIMEKGVVLKITKMDKEYRDEIIYTIEINENFKF